MSGILDFIHDSEVFIDLYSILGIEMDVNISEIKIAFINLAKKQGKIPIDYFKLIMHLLKKSIKKIVTDHPYATVEEQAGYLLEYYYKPNYLVGLSQPLPKIYYDAYNFLKEILENSK